VGADYKDDALKWSVPPLPRSISSGSSWPLAIQKRFALPTARADRALPCDRAPLCLAADDNRVVLADVYSVAPTHSKVCGTGYKLPNGEVVESEGTLLSGLFSKTQATRLPVFATLVQGGKVKMGVAPRSSE